VKLVAASDDDAHERADGTGFDSTLAQLESFGSGLAFVRAHCAMRFTDIQIPQGAVISGATLRVYVPSLGDDRPWLRIHCEDVDNAANFTDTPDVTSRALTSASTEWAVSDLGSIGYHQTPSFIQAIQEVIDRPGWAAGNALMVIFRGLTSSTPSGSSGQLVIESFDEVGGHPAELTIDHQGEVSGPGTGTLTPDQVLGGPHIVGNYRVVAY
jgi:hypothetical protein